jgi:hypothetical protein
VHELRAELDADRKLDVVHGEDASADALSRLQYDDIEPGLVQRMGSGESGDTGADHDDINSRSIHDYRVPPRGALCRALIVPSCLSLRAFAMETAPTGRATAIIAVTFRS